MSQSVGSNVISIYVANITAAGLTFLFWVISSNYTGSEVIGTVSVIASFSMVLGILANFDIGVGMKRFLGIAIAEKNLLKFKNLVSVAISFSLVTAVGVILIVMNPFFNFIEMVGIEDKFVPILIVVVIGNNLQHIFIGSLVSSMRSKSIVLPSLIASISRFPVLLLMFNLIGENEVSVAWAYATLYAVICIGLFIVTMRYLFSIPGPFIQNYKEGVVLLVRGSLARWIPQVIKMMGSQLGILSVYAIKGASETGLFYISFAVFNVLFMLSHAMNHVSHPVISGLSEEEKQNRFLRKTIKMTFLGIMPVAVAMFFYSESILNIFGTQFDGASEILPILVIGFPLAIISDGIYFFLYAQGKYKQVLGLGLSSSIPRIILYFYLVPIYGGVGGAMAFIVGYAIEVIFALIIITKTKTNLPYKKIIPITIIPFLVGIILQFTDLGIFGALAIFFFSYILYLRLNLLDVDDIGSILTIFSKPEKLENRKTKTMNLLKKTHLIN